MPSFTKKAIIDSFLLLIEKKPLEKITVRDLVDECGINRNTFYYYFQDIYAVLEEYCDMTAASLAQEKSPQSLLLSLLRYSRDFTASRPRAAKMLAFSLGHEGLERYLGTRLEPVLRKCMLQNEGISPTPTALRFVRHAMIGLCLDIMRADKNVTVQDTELLPLLQALFA